MSDESSGLEPAAVMCSNCLSCTTDPNGPHAYDDEVLEGCQEANLIPLFHGFDVVDRIDQLREKTCYCDGGDGVDEPECHFCAFARELREELKEVADQ